MALREAQELHKRLNAEDSACNVFNRVLNEGVEVMKGRCRSFVDISCDVKVNIELALHSRS